MMNSLSKGGKDTVKIPGLEHPESFFETVAMGGPGLSIVINGQDSSILFANTMFREYSGLSAEALNGKVFLDFMAPYQHDRFRQNLADVKGCGGECNAFVIYYMLDKAGNQNAFYLFGSLVKTNAAAGNEIYHIQLLPDKSRWGMPFTSFETRELFLEHFKVEGFGTFEWILDTDQLFWSIGMYKIYDIGHEVKAITREFARQFVHPQDRSMVDIQLEEALKSGSDFSIEFRITTPANNLKLLHCLARVVKDKDGRFIKFAGSVRDITAQKSKDNILKNKVEELRRSNRELEEFAYAASHDMQEPLRKITTFSDRLSEKYKGVLEGEGQMYLSRMVASAENMRLLINGLLDFSKISQETLPFEHVNLNSIVMQVMQELELKIEETGTAIRCEVLPVIFGVASQMRQLFINLISNAIKFQNPGVAPIIKLEIKDVGESEIQRFNLQPKVRYIKIIVSDNGIGFEGEYADRIFQVFQRLHGKSEYPGSGIGLAICKKILEYHNGVIYAENNDGVGARFVFLLPMHQSAEVTGN